LPVSVTTRAAVAALPARTLALVAGAVALALGISRRFISLPAVGITSAFALWGSKF